jgi:hypothetical protein
MEKKRGDGVVYPPPLPVLAATIAASKTGDLTFLVTERGTPFVKESFGNWFRDACRAAGCPGSAHGLRKAGATRAAENGATVHQLMALFGWKTEKMASIYIRVQPASASPPRLHNCSYRRHKRGTRIAAPWVRCGRELKLARYFKPLDFRWCPELGGAQKRAAESSHFSSR